ncbi:hypothetical protein [Adoxophyes orana nucleopolyhedrovirus]|uniref:hypothetical protein n=1 Tax=Adoxophyes orana nucleopolyhedrovirus TaxID=542343 RepID=UPI0001829C0C|nr:hypothetical protein [Adoxophyes orana nucleopolyhedrovirus]ACF05353.1 hypothetical protein [Adoxophyes orana nucleopolyhedrovirus]
MMRHSFYNNRVPPVKDTIRHHPHQQHHQPEMEMTTTTTMITHPTDHTTNQFHVLQNLKLKNATILNRIKYDPELLIHYLFNNYHMLLNDNTQLTDCDLYNNINVIKICKVKVKKSCGAILAHYYAHINLFNNYSFEFHPGSQPKTFQTVHTNGHVIYVMILCNTCCEEELRNFITGENSFNVAFKNCESILCKRKSFQTIIIATALLFIFVNMIKFSWYFIFLVSFLMFLLYVNNNYMISNPEIVYCDHLKIKTLHHDRTNFKR